MAQCVLFLITDYKSYFLHFQALLNELSQIQVGAWMNFIITEVYYLFCS